MPTCLKCGTPLSQNEIGLHRKMLSRDAREFFCIRCLSVYLEIPEELLRKKITDFQKAGCALFSPYEE